MTNILNEIKKDDALEGYEFGERFSVVDGGFHSFVEPEDRHYRDCCAEDRDDCHPNVCEVGFV